MKGYLITFEGPEGSGKTTVMKRLAEYLELKGYNVIKTREPGGTVISEKIRGIILDINHKEMAPETEALLYAASRTQHIVEVIKPNIEKGNIILCDRYLDSSLVYQGYARGLGIEKVLEINKYAVENSLPDLTIFFDIKPRIGLNRIKDNHRVQDRLDLEKLEFHDKVYMGYRTICDIFTDRIKIVNAENDQDTVYNDVQDLICKFLEKK